MRKNSKLQIVNYENSIKKSNALSIAKLNHGLTINQVQLLAYAIFSTQKDGKTTFHKSEFEKKFNIEYKTERARDDSRKLSRLQVATENLEENYFSFWNVFAGMEYKRGLFTFEWTTHFIPHILDLKDKYITNDLTVTSKFKSAFTWTLYDYLKGLHGYWSKSVSKDELLKLFCVENVPSYKDTAQFKRTVLNVAIREINEHTELLVTYVEEKKGRAIVGFTFNWSIPYKKVIAATTNQIKQITLAIDTVEKDMWKCIDEVKDSVSDQVNVMNIIRKILAYRREIHSEFTRERADEILTMLKMDLHQLDMILITATNNENDVPTKIFYNWLIIRE